MNDRKTLRGAPRAPEDPAEGWAASLRPGQWHERVPGRDRTAEVGRHSAITRTLYNYASYKSWADKVRTSWDDAAAEAQPAAPVPRAPR